MSITCLCIVIEINNISHISPEIASIFKSSIKYLSHVCVSYIVTDTYISHVCTYNNNKLIKIKKKFSNIFDIEKE